MKKLSQSLRGKEETGSWLLSLVRLASPQGGSILFYLLLLFLPTQLGKHFWPLFSYVSGIRIDYLSPTLYATDILIALLFFTWVAQFQISNFKFQIKSKFLNSKFPIAVFTLSLIVGIVASKSPAAGFFGLLKLLEFTFLGFYVATHFNILQKEIVLILFSIGILFESILSISQLLNYGSLQGIFYFFGERMFNPQTIGVANASLDGALVLRPYGTFSHPNVLAGYLTIAMAMVISNFKFQISNIRKIFYCLTISIGTVALFLTLSRVAIVLWGLLFCVFLIRKFLIHHSSFIILALVCIGSIVAVTPLGIRFTGLRLTDETIVQRESLIQNSIAMIKDRPIFGVGLNNFLVNLPSYQKPGSSPLVLQPVHNIFLLGAAETGIVGLSFFTWFLIKTYRRVRHSYLLLLLSYLLLLGLFDHYFLTLVQGQLLFAFVLGLCWSKHKT